MGDMATVTEQIKRLREQETTEERDTCTWGRGRRHHKPGADATSVRPCGERMCDRHWDGHADRCADCAAVRDLDDTTD